MPCKRNKPHEPRTLACSVCGSGSQPYSRYQGGYVCYECLDKVREGTDMTTRALRDVQRANRAARNLELPDEDHSISPEKLDYVMAAGSIFAADAMNTPVQCVRLAGGEIAEPSAETAPKMTANIVALEASNERVDLISSLGNDIAALALDTADSMGATGSVEQMLAHQIATAHHQAMMLVSKAAVEEDATHQLRLSGLAAKWMAITHSAALSLRKFKNSGEQRITIQHVNVTDGGQAVIGEVRAGGK